MASVTRLQVLSVFKRLQRTRQQVFAEDSKGLEFMRTQIKEEFRKHQNVSDTTEITKLIGIAKESDEILKTKVVQMKETRPNIFQIRKEHLQEKCTKDWGRCPDCTCGRAK